ncbi:uncharacterized protein LOC114286917 [Camellia sinensis]|uniref:uncharacterized protein LOC114286917 n=1 Tax=Camellia sinensis TaxID=4442 RepID=UPI001035CFA7|nr:uncharacterized protein LOC114286917 [Camellia sinensis]
MKILSWNVRGLGRADRRQRIKEFLSQKYVDMVLLQETKRSCMDESGVRSLWPIDSVEFMEVGADGSAGGLLCVWDPLIFSLKECRCFRSFILLADLTRRKLWGILSNLKSIFPNPWYLGGDFNESWNRIDQFLVNPDWLEWFKYKVWGLPRFFSDHSPILLMEDDRNWGPKPFKFINAWVLHPDFLDEAKRAWESSGVQGWACYIIMEKLRVLKVALKK